MSLHAIKMYLHAITLYIISKVGSKVEEIKSNRDIEFLSHCSRHRMLVIATTLQLPVMHTLMLIKLGKIQTKVINWRLEQVELYLIWPWTVFDFNLVIWSKLLESFWMCLFIFASVSHCLTTLVVSFWTRNIPAHARLRKTGGGRKRETLSVTKI